VLVLHALEELPMREVAEAVGAPLQTAYSRFYAAKKDLAALLGELAPAGELAPVRDPDVGERVARLAIALGPLLAPPTPGPATVASGAGAMAKGATIAKVIALAAAAGAGIWIASHPVPVADPVAEAEPVAEPEPEPEPENETEPETEAEPETEPETEAETELEAEPEPEPEPENHTETHTETHTQTQAVPETEPEPESGTPESGAGSGSDPDDVPSELDLIRRAQTLLRSDPSSALSAADAHARTHPAGAFADEREILAVDALVRLGRRDEAVARADRFRATHPASPYLRRLERIVAP
jgi:outer membrane biosynthesis protein TonB